MSTAFLNALKNKSASMQSSMVQASTVAPTVPDATPSKLPDGFKIIPSVRIERILNNNRIDVIFSDIPDVALRDKLKDHGFHFNGERKAWYHKDTLLNRLFLADLLGADELRTIEPATPVEPTPVVSNESDDEFTSDEYRNFKIQCASLQAELRIDAADLMLKAIDCLYTQTFKVN